VPLMVRRVAKEGVLIRCAAAPRGDGDQDGERLHWSSRSVEVAGFEPAASSVRVSSGLPLCGRRFPRSPRTVRGKIRRSDEGLVNELLGRPLSPCMLDPALP
jgi:hypothetical protein